MPQLDAFGNFGNFKFGGQTTIQDPFQNPFYEFLDEEPRAAFFSLQDLAGTSPNRRRLFQDDFSNLYNEYLGFLGKQVREGKSPVGSSADFFGNIDFDRRYGQLTPEQRGQRTSRFNPITRFR